MHLATFHVRAGLGIPCQAPVGVEVSVSECVVACPFVRKTQYCNQTIYIILGVSLKDDEDS